MTGFTLVIVALIAPVSALAGVLAGAVLSYRLGKGMPPLPPLPKRTQVTEPAKPEPRPIPKLRA